MWISRIGGRTIEFWLIAVYVHFSIITCLVWVTLGFLGFIWPVRIRFKVDSYSFCALSRGVTFVGTQSLCLTLNLAKLQDTWYWFVPTFEVIYTYLITRLVIMIKWPVCVSTSPSRTTIILILTWWKNWAPIRNLSQISLVISPHLQRIWRSFFIESHNVSAVF